jgi:YVTN family beta-propeller protein
VALSEFSVSMTRHVSCKTKDNHVLAQPAGSGIRSRTTALVSLCGVFAVALLTSCANTNTTNAGTGIPVGFQPSAIAITPDGTTAYVVSGASDNVTPINLATKTPGSPIKVAYHPVAIAITQDGSAAYVVSVGGNTEAPSVTPIDLATKTPGTPFKVGEHPAAIAITPNGTTAYLVNYNPNSPGFSPSPPPGPSSVTPIDLATRTPGPTILGPFGKGFQDLRAIAITPDARTAYVVNHGNDSVTPINLATNTLGPAIMVGRNPHAIAITPDGTTAYVANYWDTTVTPINIANNTPLGPISWTTRHQRDCLFGAGCAETPAIAITPDGGTAYVVNYFDNSVTPINLATKTAGTAIPVGHGPAAIAIAPDGSTAYVVDLLDSSVVPVNLATGTRA